MQERSLKVYNTEKTFFVKISSKLTQLLMPTKFGINNIMISLKRNNVLKAYYNYKEIANQNDSEKGELLSKKYEDTYTLYLEAIDKYIMESLYKKVKNNLASQFEKDALSNYYTIVSLKENYYTEYKYRKQKYLLELDYKSISEQNKLTALKKVDPFYLEKIDSLYKGIIKNYSVQLVDSLNKEINKSEIYEKIFDIIEEYATNVLPIKMKQPEQDKNSDLVQEYDRYQRFLAGKLNDVDEIEKNMVLMSISRLIFTYSLPLVTAEKCYSKILDDARELVVKYNNTGKYESIYNLLIRLMEEYNLKLLSTKVYWDKPEEREEYKKFWNEYKNIQNISSEKEQKEQKEKIFIKDDLKALIKTEDNYKEIIKIYKKRLVELGVMKQLKAKPQIIQNGKYVGKTKINTLQMHK